jgi:putative transposase
MVVPGVPYHITQRGNRREEVFFSEADRTLYLKLLLEYGHKHGLAVKGYCLMTNHVHLVAVPERESTLCDVFKPVHLRYAQHVNWTRGVTGHVWQGRFFSCALDDSHYIQALRYVERNPVRAGLVDSAEAYSWSSAAGHCGLRQDVFAADTEGLTEQVGDWRAFLGEQENPEEMEQLRLHTRTGRPLGGVMFLNLLETLLNRTVRLCQAGRPRKERVEK